MTSRLLINEPPILVFPSLAVEVGANEAMVLQQIHYWLTSKGHKHHFDGDVWVRNTYDEWGKQFPFMANKTLRRAISSLEELELIQSFVAHEAFRKTKFYTILYDNVDKLDLPFRTYTRASTPTVPSVSGCRQGSAYQTGVDNKLTDHAISGCASGQIDQIDLPNLDDNPDFDVISGSPCGQIDQTNLVKMTRSYTEAETTFRDIIIPPPNPPQVTSSEDVVGFKQIHERSNLKMAGSHLGDPACHSQLKASEEEDDLNQISFQEVGVASRDCLSLSSYRIAEADLGKPARAAQRKASEDEEEDLSSRMIKIWNRLVQGKIKDAPRKELSLHDSRKRALEIFFNGILDGDFAEWERYCLQIAGTQFLLGNNGSGFKVSLEWALNVPNALKVLEGRIYDKPQDKAQPAKQLESGDFEVELRDHFAHNGYPLEWMKVYQILCKHKGQSFFTSWLKGCVPLALRNNQAVILAPTRFHRDYMTSNYHFELKAAAQACWPDLNDLTIEVKV
jgi:hypothetical protein